jgi:hypothetical protein
LARLAVNQADLAVGDYERAIALDPNLMDAYIDISIALEENKAGMPLDLYKTRFYSQLPAQEREGFDRMYKEIKALKGGR